MPPATTKWYQDDAWFQYKTKIGRQWQYRHVAKLELTGEQKYINGIDISDFIVCIVWYFEQFLVYFHGMIHAKFLTNQSI